MGGDLSLQWLRASPYPGELLFLRAQAYDLAVDKPATWESVRCEGGNVLLRT